ncbi:MAG: aldo/keto reductase [Nitrospiraceae bacterium]
MTKVCTHGRDKKVAMQQLEESLRRLKTDYLDLWQIHEVVYEDDPIEHFAPNGAADALLEANGRGRCACLIHWPAAGLLKIHLKMLVRLPVRCLPDALERVRRDVPKLRTGSGAGIATARDCCDRYEEPGAGTPSRSNREL